MQATIEVRRAANDNPGHCYLVLARSGAATGGVLHRCVAFGARSQQEALALAGKLMANLPLLTASALGLEQPPAPANSNSDIKGVASPH